MITFKMFGDRIDLMYSIAKKKQFDLEDKIQAMLYDEIQRYHTIDTRDVITTKQWLDALIVSYNVMLTRSEGIVKGTYPVSDNSDGYHSILAEEMRRKIRKTSRVLEVINQYMTLLHISDDTKTPKSVHMDWEAKSDELTIGDRIKKRLKTLGMTQRELSDLTGISETKITRYIKGTIEPRSLEVSSLAVVLETTVEYLTGEDN